MAEKRKSSKAKPNVEVVKVGSNNYVLFRPCSVYPGIVDKKALHIGNLDNNKVFQPSSVYFELTKDYKEALVFPSDWSLKNIAVSSVNVSIKTEVKASQESLTRNTKAAELAPELKTIVSQINYSPRERVNFGATWLLYQVSLQLGIVEDLLKVFGGDREKVNRILSVAFFTLMEKGDYEETEDWQQENFLLSRALLDYEGVVRIFSTVTQDECDDFMRLRRERLTKDQSQEEIGYLCIQTSSSFNTDICLNEFKEPVGMGRYNNLYLVFYTHPFQDRGDQKKIAMGPITPFYLAEIPCNSSDKEDAEEIVKLIDHVFGRENGLNRDNLCVISDLGRVSISNLDPLFRSGIKFQAQAYPNESDIKRIIKEDFPKEGPSPSEVSLFERPNDEIFFQEITRHKLSPVKEVGSEDVNPSQAKTVELTTTVIFTPVEQEDWIRVITDEVNKQSLKAQRVIDKEVRVSDLKAFERNCDLLKFKFDSETGEVEDFFHNEEKIENEIFIAGFEAFRTFGFEPSCAQVMNMNSQYLEQDYFLSPLIGKYEHNRLVNNEKEALQGRRLVALIALLLHNHLDQEMSDNSILRVGVEPSDLLKEVNNVYAIERVGQIYLLGKNVTRYRQILEALGGNLPSGVKHNAK